MFYFTFTLYIVNVYSYQAEAIPARMGIAKDDACIVTWADANTLVYAGYRMQNGTIDTTTGLIKKNISPGKAYQNAIWLSSDGSKWAYREDGSVHIRNITKDRELNKVQLINKFTPIDIQVIKNSMYINGGKQIDIYDINTGMITNTINSPDAISVVAMRIFPDEKFIIMGGDNGAIILYSIADKKVAHRYMYDSDRMNDKNAVSCLAIADDNKTILAGFSNGLLVYLDGDTFKILYTHKFSYCIREISAIPKKDKMSLLSTDSPKIITMSLHRPKDSIAVENTLYKDLWSLSYEKTGNKYAVSTARGEIIIKDGETTNMYKVNND